MTQIVDFIKYEGENDAFIWKHPCEDFSALTQLIVGENQEAAFFLNGQVLELFCAGQYTLEGLLERVLNGAPDDGASFHGAVYFLNKSELMSIKWGTDSKVQYIEPTYGFPLSIGASGEMSLRVADSRMLLRKLSGTENFFDQQKLVAFFRAFLMTPVKAYIAQFMKENAISIFEIDEHLTALSDALKQQLLPDFAEYGVVPERFFVTNVVKPDGERQYEKCKELHFRQYADIAEAKLRQQTEIINAETEAQKAVIDSKAQATKRAQEGYTYQEERTLDMTERAQLSADAMAEFKTKVEKLSVMKGAGLLTDEEFEKEKAELLKL